MRFDGEKSIVEAKSDSLKLKGDFTYALWVRQNAIEKSANCPLFGGPFYGFSVSAYTNLTFSVNSQDAAGDDLAMSWPVDREILGTDWSHLTVVVAYPRIRFYRNGQLIRDAWMPFSLESPREKGNKITLGSSGRYFGFVDLDEVMVFNRALSAADVKDLATGKLPAGTPQVDIQMEPYWYEDKLTMRLSSHHQFDLNGQTGQAKFHLKTLDGQERTLAVPCQPSRAMGTPRTVASADFPLEGFTAKAFRAQVEVSAADGSVLGTVAKDFLLQKPEWVHTRLGHTDSVPEPWTPVELVETKTGKDIHVWGRRYSVDDQPFFAQVESKGVAMLAEPMRLNAIEKLIGSGIAEADTLPEPTYWTHEGTQWSQTGGMAATYVQKFSSAGLDLEIASDIEYDGFGRFDCKITARQDTELSQFFLEIPVVSSHSYYAYGHSVRPAVSIMVGKKKRTDYSHMNQSGRFEESLQFPFSCDVHLGDDERLLVWQAESPANWNNSDPQKMIEILKDPYTHTMRIRFIDQITVLRTGEERVFTFALFATPMKPMPRTAWDLRIARSEPMCMDLDWADRKFQGQPALDHVVNMGIRSVLMLNVPIWPYPMPLGNEWYAQQLKRNVQALHDRGLNIYNYLVHQRFSLAAPEFELNGMEMAVGPFRTYGGPGARRDAKRPGANPPIYGPASNTLVNVCPASHALRDANVHSLYKRLEYFGEDGVYLDGTGSYHWLCKNTRHGCGYTGPDGKIHPSRPIFGIRKYMQRIYVAIKSINPDHIIDIGDSFGSNPSGFIYADSTSTGERWHHLNETRGGAPHVASALPLDVARHEFTGRQHNMPMYVHSHRLGDYAKISATTLLLDVPVLASVDGTEPLLENIDEAGETNHHQFSGDTQIFSLVCRIRDRFGVDGAKRVLYYEGVEKYATIDPGSEQCYTTLYLHPENGVLAFVTNHAIDGQAVDIKFDLDALALTGKKIQVLDTMYNRNLPIDPSGRITLDLESEQWTYLWLKPNR